MKCNHGHVLKKQRSLPYAVCTNNNGTPSWMWSQEFEEEPCEKLCDFPKEGREREYQVEIYHFRHNKCQDKRPGESCEISCPGGQKFPNDQNTILLRCNKDSSLYDVNELKNAKCKIPCDKEKLFKDYLAPLNWELATDNSCEYE